MIRNQISKNSIALLLLGSVSLAFSSIGCTGDGFPLARVSGTVTVDGTPVPDLRIAFSPMSTEENPTPGPFSTGTTDSEGKFTLTSRGGQTGAVIGPHRVTLRLPANATKAKLRDANEHLDDLRAEGNKDPASVKAAKDSIAKIQKRIREYDFVPARLLDTPIGEVDVPAEGIENHLIEMKKGSSGN